MHSSFADMTPYADDRRVAPATGRNRDPILAVLRRVLPLEGLILEIASGTGEHVAYFSGHFPRLVWQPTDPDPALRASIAAWTTTVSGTSILAPLDLDATRHPWPVARADAVLCINMIHISPWTATEGLMRGAAHILPAGGLLYLYGPYKRGGRHTAPSNAQFDESLRAQNASWGVRNLDEVVQAAAAHGLRLHEIIDMPANNLSVIFRRDS